MKNWERNHETFVGKEDDVGKVSTLGMRRHSDAMVAPGQLEHRVCVWKREVWKNGMGPASSRPRRVITTLTKNSKSY